MKPEPNPWHRWAWSARGAIWHGLAVAVDRPLLRLVLDRWPTAAECRQFRQALLHSPAPLPPLLRGLAAVAGARAPLTRTMLLSWLLADENYRGPMRDGLGSYVPHGDHLQVWNRPPVSLLHIEKTAGTALVSWLAAQFHPAQIDPDPWRSVPPHVASPFAHQAARRLGGYALVHGHYDLPSLRRLGAGRTVVLMLREPRARLLSMYYFWRSIDDRSADPVHGSRNVQAAHACTLLEFLTSADPFIVNYVDNLYVRRLTGAYAGAGEPDPLAVNPEAVLQAALAALGSIDAVGVTERMGESVARIGRALDLPATARSDAGMAVANDAAGNLRQRPGEFRPVAREPITPEIDRALDHLTRLDRIVYEAALRRLASGPDTDACGPAGDRATGAHDIRNAPR